MIDIKICGITNYKDAMHAKTAGASAIGMIFYNKSPRFIDIENAKKICINVPRMKKIDTSQINISVPRRFLMKIK